MNFYSGIGHYTDTVMDWLKYKADGKEGYNIILAARLSGTPHIGTLVNFMVGYKLAFELRAETSPSIRERPVSRTSRRCTGKHCRREI